jgi:hypothetical protein
VRPFSRRPVLRPVRWSGPRRRPGRGRFRFDGVEVVVGAGHYVKGAVRRWRAADGDACGVDVGLAGEPEQCGVAVFQRHRERVLGCEPVLHRDDDDVELLGDPAAEPAVLRRVAEHHSAAVDPQQRRRPRPGRSRPEDVYRHVVVHGDDLRVRPPSAPGELGEEPERGKRSGADDGAGKESRGPQLRVERLLSHRFPDGRPKCRSWVRSRRPPGPRHCGVPAPGGRRRAVGPSERGRAVASRPSGRGG